MSEEPENPLGPFAAVWEKGSEGVPAHLKLLHFSAEEAQEVLDAIEGALRESDPLPWLAWMYQEVDWRPHLVASAAALMLQDLERLPPLLWSCLERGSWVSPQLAATLSFLDPAFLKRARARVEAGAAVTLPQDMNALLQHSAMGPAGRYHRSCKEVNALLILCDTFPEARTWVDEMRQTPPIATMLREDFDSGDRIALGWALSATKQFRQRGLDLDPEQRLDAYLQSGRLE